MTNPWESQQQWFQGKGVIVTGAAGGIGMAVMEAFAGSKIIAIDLDEESSAQAIAGSRCGESVPCLPIGVDLADDAQVAASLKRIRSFTKDVAVLVNVAGIAVDANSQMLSRDSLLQQFQVNFFAAFAYAQFAARLMTRRGGGAIVNVASITGIDGNSGQLAYGASKAALVNATRTMSLELGSQGIRVNAVAPGVIDTPMTRALPTERLAALASRSSMNRLGRAEEVASVVRWLASPAASYVTGQTIRVDGCI